jgi:hypothetical protein
MAGTVAVLQSNYLPWKGYFDLIGDVDLFVFYDDVQYTKNDWRNRNRIKTAQGLRWLTVPVGAHIHRRVFEVEIPDPRWQAVHWKTLQQCYARAPHFARYAPFFEEVYLGRAWTNLSALNQFLIKTIAADFLGLRTRFADSRDWSLPGTKGARLLALLERLGASAYVSGPAARSYLDERAFAAVGIAVSWKSYDGYPEYPQLHPPFEHQVSVVDLLFHLGPDAAHWVRGWREGGRRAARPEPQGCEA